MKVAILITLFVFTEIATYGQFEKGISFFNTSGGYHKAKESSQDIDFNRNFYSLGLNFGYGYFFKKNQAVSFGLGYLASRNHLEYSGTALQNQIQSTNGFECALGYALYYKKERSFFISHQFDVRYSFQKSRGQSSGSAQLSDIASRDNLLSFTISPIVLNYQLNERFFISTSSFLSLYASFKKYKETNRLTNRTDVTKQSDYQVSFSPTIASVSVFYLIGSKKAS